MSALSLTQTSTYPPNNTMNLSCFPSSHDHHHNHLAINGWDPTAPTFLTPLSLTATPLSLSRKINGPHDECMKPPSTDRRDYKRIVAREVSFDTGNFVQISRTFLSMATCISYLFFDR
jgi:hypothetical protein